MQVTREGLCPLWPRTITRPASRGPRRGEGQTSLQFKRNNRGWFLVHVVQSSARPIVDSTTLRKGPVSSDHLMERELGMLFCLSSRVTARIETILLNTWRTERSWAGRGVPRRDPSGSVDAPRDHPKAQWTSVRGLRVWVGFSMVVREPWCSPLCPYISVSPPI